MSASREKKLRQELAASGIPDIKEIRAQEERKQQRRANWLYGSVAAIFVLVAAALLIWNSNIIQRSSTAISVDGVKYSAAEVNYYYNNAYNSVASSDYISYMSLNTSSPLNQQVMNEMDLMFMGITLEEGEEMTWDEYFIQVAKDNLIQQTALLKGAEAAGFTFNDEMQAEMDATLEALDTYAQQSGVSTSAYLKSLFGSSMTTGTFKTLLKDAILASYFQQDYINNLTYTSDELEQYYRDNADTFDVVDYEYIYFKGTAASTTDADGNTVAATDEENAAAKAAAEAAAKAALARYEAGEDLKTIAEDYEMGTYYSQEAGSNTGGTMQEWLFEEGRAAGDKTMLNSSSTYYVVGFNSRSRNDYNTVNVRHILCKVDSSALDSTAENYADQLQVLINEQKAEAERLLAEWKAGAATAESFAELANANSDDGGSNTNGGLYTQIAKGQMVEEFEAWCFDESRQVGDTGIVYVESTNYTGYHIMYFDGVDDPYWQIQVENAMMNEDYSAWSAALIEGLTAEEHSGMKYVG